jgi:c-di-GMP-binding flagellar brake protein YcgR
MPSSRQSTFNADNHDELIARCTLHSRAEILFQLRAIQKRKLLVNLDLPGSRQIVVTSVLGVNETNNTVILDSARGDALNHELLSGKGADFIAQLDGVSITFSTGPVTLCTYEKLPALRISIPKSLVRLQRREHFRVPLPIANPVRCIVPSPTADDSDPISTHIVISAAAAWLAETSGRIGPTGLILHATAACCPEADAVITFRWKCAIRPRYAANGSFQNRPGCKFADLPNDMAARLQRFVMDIERAPQQPIRKPD